MTAGVCAEETHEEECAEETVYENRRTTGVMSDHEELRTVGSRSLSPTPSPHKGTKQVIIQITPVSVAGEAFEPEDNLKMLGRIHEVVLGPLTKAHLCQEFKILQLAASIQVDLVVPFDLVIIEDDKLAWQNLLEASIVIMADGEVIKKRHQWSNALPSKDASMELDLSYPSNYMPPGLRNPCSGSGSAIGSTESAASASTSPGQRDGGITPPEGGSMKLGRSEQCRDRNEVHLSNFRSSGIPDTEGALLKTAMCDALWSYLPVELKWKRWRLAYKVALHGVSFQTFHANLENQGPSVLVVQDETGAVFGGFAATSWTKQTDRYTGTGASFVFRWKEKRKKESIFEPTLAYKILEEHEDFTAKFANEMKGREVSQKSLHVYREECHADWRRTQDIRRLDPQAVSSVTEALDDLDSCMEDDVDLEVYGWKDERYPYFQFFDGVSLAFGGGECPAFYLEDEFKQGGSGKSLTYGNPVLSGFPEFNVHDVECWRFE